MSFTVDYPFANVHSSLEDSSCLPSFYEDESLQCYNCIGHCICTREFFSNFEDEEAYEADNFEIDLNKYNYLDIDDEKNIDHPANSEYENEETSREECNEEFETAFYDQEDDEDELNGSENSDCNHEEYSNSNKYDSDSEEADEADPLCDIAGTSDCENEDTPSRCTTPVQLDEERWESHIRHLEFTKRHFEMEVDAKNIVAEHYKETCFTVIKSEVEFFVVVPFGNNPVYQSITFPVNPELIRDLTPKIPSWMSYRLHELNTFEGFKEFANFFHNEGSGYRMSLLMKRAINEAIKRPERERRLAEVADDSDSDEDDDDVFATPFKVRERRTRRDAAVEIDGRTPFGRRHPMRQRSLFRDEEEERQVKRRRLDLEMED